jgi:hypothetical protein
MNRRTAPTLQQFNSRQGGLTAAAACGINCRRKGTEAMSFNIELELQKFPKVIALKDGTKATLRPLRRDD